MLGFLAADGLADLAAIATLVEVIGAGPGVDESRWTFHRAIDRATDRDVLRRQLAGLPGLDTYLTAGSAPGVDHGLPTLRAEAARTGAPGYEARWSGSGAAFASTTSPSCALRASPPSTSAARPDPAAGTARWTRPPSDSGASRWTRRCRWAEAAFDGASVAVLPTRPGWRLPEAGAGSGG